MKNNLLIQICISSLLMLFTLGLTSQNIYDFTSIPDANENGDLKMPSTHNFQYIVHEGEFGTLDLYDFTAYVPINNSNTNGYLSINHEFNNGGVTVFDINQNASKVWAVSNPKQVQYGVIDRPCSGAVTSWGAVLSCEEVSQGRVLETDPSDGSSIWRHQLGLLAHENVVENTDNNRTFYTGEDTGNGVVLKFVADNPSDLSSGDLYVLDLDPGGTSGTWDLIPNNINTDTHAEAVAVGGSTFSGVEDIEINPIDGKVYFAVKGTGTIYRFDEDTPLGGGTVSNFEEYVTNQTYNTGNGTAQFGTGIDNLAFDNAGNLWAFQDGGDNQIWVIENGHTMANPMVKLFGQAPNGAEPTGITFTPDFKYLFMSVMHPNGNDSANQPDVWGNTVPNNLDYAVVISRNENWNNDIPFSTLDLDNYNSNCDVDELSGPLGATEISGITYSGQTETLFAVSDSLYIHELNLDGSIIRTISLSGFQDTESIVWMGGNQFAIAEERRREIVFVTINPGTSSLSYPAGSQIIEIVDSGEGQNNGFEGLAYDTANDILYIAKEGDQDNNNTGIEPKIYKISDPFSELGNTITNPVEAFSNYPTCTNFDASGLATSPTGSLLLVSEQCEIVYELNPNDGSILSSKSVSLFQNPEGIVMVNDNELWVVGENDGVASELRQYVIIGSTCDDEDPNTSNDVYDATCGCAGTPNDCPTVGQPCNDNDPCTDNDVFGSDITCPCAGTYSGDSDGDGVCNNLDICPGFDDNLIGTTCDDGNPNTENDVYTNNCLCEGTPITTCPTVGQPCNDNDPCTDNDVFGSDITCPCVGTYSGDSDGDGVCNNLDICPGFDDNLIGTTCNDGDPNTENDVYTTNCICEGTPVPGCVDQNAESFETGFGTWIQGTGDDLDWTRDSGGTPSSSTGPSTGSDGSWYLFIEASGNGSGYPNKTAILESPCYNVPDSYGIFQFDYHMYGTAANMLLEFQISSDDGNTWTTVWTQQGNQGNQWNTATINLFPYAESTVKLRFFGTTGETWQGDIAIDNIDVFPSGCPDIGLPCDDNDPCTINDALDNLCNCVGVFQDSDNDGICDANDICPFLNNALIGTSCDDGNPNTENDVYTNNCICEGTTITVCTTVVPEQESFETGFGAWAQNTSDDLNWIRDANGTPSSSTGPSSAFDGTWYAYIEASGNGNGYPNKTAGLISPCYDIPADGATMNFAYHMYGSAANMQLELQVSTDDGNSWTSIWSDQGNQGNQWNSQSVDLLAYANTIIQLQFFGTTGETWQGDIAIDLLDPVLGGGCPIAGQTCDDGDPCTDNDVYGSDVSCPCAGIYSGDDDNDGVCNNLDVCPTLDDNLIGATCDDGNPNTTNDVYTINCICEGTTTISTLDLANFNSNCTIELLNSAVETSGMTYSGSTNTLFIVSDNLSIYETDLDGNLIRTISLPGFQDTEGIVWLGGNQFGITEERKREVAVVNINAGTTSIAYPGASGVIDITDSGDGDNLGFEGLAYDAVNDVLYIGKEGDQDNNNTGQEPKIYKVSNPFSEVGNTITNPVEAFTNYPMCTNFDVSGLAMSPTGSLIVVSHQCNILYELDPNDGTILSQKSVAEFQIPEGVTIINDNEIWVTGENNDLKQFVIVGSGCDDGDPNTSNDEWTSDCNCQGNSSPNCINILPEDESFENDLGIWSDATNDDLNWTRDSGGTPSSSTGPSNASDGTWYLYIEASGNGSGYPGKTAGLVSQCFDIFTTGGAQIDFDYHMYGTAATMTLEFQVSTDDGSNWTTLWSQQGNQGNQWISETVDLSAYVNMPVLFQFFGTTGTTWQGDMAIDNIYIDLNSGDCPIDGDPCDDGDPCTINDVYDNTPDCNCFGTYSGDNDGDGVCAAEDPNDNDPCIPISCGGCTLLNLEDFETGFGIWNDGGSDCSRSTGGNPSSGIWSIRLRDNSGVGSSMTTDNIDLSGFNEAEVHFHYYANSMETGEDFLLEYSTNGGGSWTIYESYVSGTDFVNNQDYFVTELISGVSWTGNTQFRIRCDASSNGDQVYIDEVEISGCSPITGMQDESDEDIFIGTETRSVDEIEIYPNPAVDKIFVDMGSLSIFDAQIFIHSMDGKLARAVNYSSDQNDQIEILTDGFANGLYQVSIMVDNGELVRKKVFVVK